MRQTDFTNDEAVGFLADRLNRLGVEEQLAKAGARAGDAVTIGEVTFDWEPTLPAGTLTIEESAGLGGRGTDSRIDAPHRVRAQERLAAKKARRTPYELSEPTWTRGRHPGRRPDGTRTTGMTAARPEIAAARRVVVKVGSSSLTTLPGGLDVARLAALVDVLAAVRAAGREAVLVSSGAIAAGLAPLRLTERPRDLATAQAAASVGQLRLVQTYADAFAAHGITVGQVLLTADDLTRRSHYRNAQQTVDRLLALGVLPIVNENDTVATEEIRFGDNDRLAALVAHVARADALVLLSDVDGVYDGDPRTGPPS